MKKSGSGRTTPVPLGPKPAVIVSAWSGVEQAEESSKRLHYDDVHTNQVNSSPMVFKLLL
jgi:hypothetical protein